MAPPVKNCTAPAQRCKPELGKGASPEYFEQSPFLLGPLDTYSLDTPTIFDPNFKWPEPPKKPPKLGEVSTDEIHRMAWEYHKHQADHDPAILKQRILASDYSNFTETTKPGEIYPLDIFGQDLPPFVAKDIPPELAQAPENAAYTLAWDGERSVVHFFELPDDGSTPLVVSDPDSGTLYITKQPNNVNGAIACWDVESPFVVVSGEDSSARWPFDLSSEEMLLGGGMFMLGNMTQGEPAISEVPAGGRSLGSRMRTGLGYSGFFVGLYLFNHYVLKAPDELAIPMEMGQAAIIGLLAEKIGPYFGRQISIPWRSIPRTAANLYFFAHGASYVWEKAGYKPGTPVHTVGSLTTSIMAYELTKYGISRMPANWALPKAIAHLGSSADDIAKLGLRTRMLVHSLRFAKVASIIGLADMLLDLGMPIYDYFSGNSKDPDHKLREKTAAETMDKMCLGKKCNTAGKVANWILPKMGIFSTGLRNAARRAGISKILPWKTVWEANMEDRRVQRADYANAWARDMNNILLLITTSLMTARKHDPKRVVVKDAGPEFLETLNMDHVEYILMNVLDRDKYRKWIDDAREVVSDFKDTKHKDMLHPDAILLWNALSAFGGKVDDKDALRKHMMELMSRDARLPLIDQIQGRFAYDSRGLSKRIRRQTHLAKRVEKELAKVTTSFKLAMQRLGLKPDTDLDPKNLTPEQRAFIYSSRPMTVAIENKQITITKMITPFTHLKKRIAALEHVLSVLKQFENQKYASPSFEWHFQKAK